MQYFFESIIKPYIIENQYRNILEIGSEYGGNTGLLLLIPSVRVSVVDPCLSADLEAKFKNQDRVKIFRKLSLEVLPKISETFDSILIDGDHNWYTVFNELKIIHERHLIKKGGTIFFHDIGWPYGRRDLYYLPESIPESFRHPFAKKGIKEKQSELQETGGFNSNLYNAIYEGGPRNGVLTAIEDFLKQFGRNYVFCRMNAEFGLGVLIKKKNIWSTFMSIKWFLIIQWREFFARAVSFVENRITLPKQS